MNNTNRLMLLSASGDMIELARGQLAYLIRMGRYFNGHGRGRLYRGRRWIDANTDRALHHTWRRAGSRYTRF